MSLSKDWKMFLSTSWLTDVAVNIINRIDYKALESLGTICPANSSNKDFKLSLTKMKIFFSMSHDTTDEMPSGSASPVTSVTIPHYEFKGLAAKNGLNFVKKGPGGRYFFQLSNGAIMSWREGDTAILDNTFGIGSRGSPIGPTKIYLLQNETKRNP